MDKKQKSLTQKLFKSGSLLFLGLGIELGIAFLAKILMAQLLGAPDYGIATIGITTLSFASTILLVGMNSGVGRYLPRFDDPGDRRGIVASALKVSLGASIAASVVLFLFAEQVATHLLRTPEAAVVLQIAAVGIPFATLLKLSIGVVQGLERSLPKVIIRNITHPIIRFTLIAVALYLGLGSQGILQAYTATFVVTGLLGLYYILTRTELLSRIETQMRRAELLRFSAPLMLTSTMIMVLSYFDIFLLSYFTTTTVVATYNVVYPLAELLTVTLSAFSFIVMPVLSKLHSGDEHEEMKRTYQIITKWIFILTLPLLLVMALFPEATIRLTFGEEYTTGSVALVVLAVGFFSHAIAGPNVNTLTSIGRTKTIMYDNLFAGVANIVLNLLLIPEYGILGAAIATAASYGSLNVLYSVQLYRATTIQPFTRALVKPAIAAVGAISVVYLAVVTLIGISVWTLVGTFGVFLVLYGIAVLLFGGVEEEEVLLVMSFEERFGVNLGPLKRIAWLFLDEEEL